MGGAEPSLALFRGLAFRLVKRLIDPKDVSRSAARAPGLRGLPIATRDRVIAKGRIRSLRGGERLFEEGDPGRAAYVVVSGTISLLRSVGDDRTVSVALRTSGEWIGELALIDGGPRSATAVADAPAAVLEIPGRVFAGLLREHPHMAIEMAAAIARRLRESDAALVEALTKRIQTLGTENRRLQREVARREGVAQPEQVVFFPGPSAHAERVRRAVRAAARSHRPVLLLGEPGAGKATLASAIHVRSTRATRPFVKVDCSLVAGPALEAHLFGEATSARKGARGTRDGAFAQADGGTLQLAAIERLPAWLQDLVVHFLQSGEYHRVGEGRASRADVRVIASSTADLEAAAKAGTFRRDLLGALQAHEIRAAPLRLRHEDVPAIVASLLREYGSEEEPVRVSASALRVLARHPFAGNHRELRAVLERACEAREGDATITGSDIERALPPGGGQWPARYADALIAFKSHVVEIALERARGNQAEASRQLGIHPSNLIRLMRSLGIKSGR